MSDNKASIAAKWHHPLSDGQRNFGEVYSELRAIGLTQDDIPFLVQLVENPKYDLPGFDLFPGATDLAAHDHLHILLGRGLRPKDEAFVLGFTMGSTNRMSGTEEWLYTLCAKYLFPRQYQFGDEEVHVFRDAVRLGFVSDCAPLNTVDFERLHKVTVNEAREACGIEQPLLHAYWQIERRRYPQSTESQRLR